MSQIRRWLHIEQRQNSFLAVTCALYLLGWSVRVRTIFSLQAAYVDQTR